jgi:hypothetical protein
MNRTDQELFEATVENNAQEVRRLLSVGADVNAKATVDKTPLVTACCLDSALCQGVSEAWSGH